MEQIYLIFRPDNYTNTVNKNKMSVIKNIYFISSID